MMLKDFFEKNYKKIMIGPIVLLIFSLCFIGYNYATTGEIFNRDVSLKGGISASLYTERGIDILGAEEKISNELGTEAVIRELTDFSTGKRLGYVVDVGNVNVRDKLKAVLEKNFEISLNEKNYSVEEIGSSLGSGFYKDMLKAMIFAFILMGIVVFVAFRTFIPSLAVMLSALLDISATLVIIDLIDLKISIAGIAAFLLVIGYSVDTDILLTTRVLRRRDIGEVYERMVGSIKTGLTMTATTFVALSAGYFITSSLVLKEMFLIILISLVIDIFSTYFMNAEILYWYVQKKGETK